MALLLGACALTPESRVLAPMAAVPLSFEMSGRIAVRSGQQNEIARLRWAHSPASDRWVIASPLGNEVARIDSDAEGATLQQAGGAPQRAPSFAALTQRLLGVALDPRELAGWLHGVAPELAGGWTVTLDERQAAGQVEIARRMSASRGDVTVRLVVDDYRALAE
jgi:outer membrane biogenesis lipoprotein LolB